MNTKPTEPVLLMIAERFPPDLGGVSRSAHRTAQAIARLGWRVHVLAWTKSLPPGEVETVESPEPNASQSSACESTVTVHRLGLFSNWDFSMQHTTNVLEWLHQTHDYSAAWGHYVYPAGYLAVVFAESMGIPSTVSARGNDIDRLMFPPGDFGRLMWTLQRATVISCVSDDLAKKVQMLLGRKTDTVVLPNVVDRNLFAPSGQTDPQLRGELGIGDEESVLGFCGELRHKKGLPFILSALLEVRQDRPACLLVIGEARPRERAHLAAFANEHPDAAARILVTGSLTDPRDVARHYGICDVVLQPSVWDGMPNAVLEAMACGKIVIASDAGGIPEAIEHGVSGFVISKSQLHHLGVAILEVLNLDDQAKETIATAAIARIKECFQADVEAKRLAALFQRLVPDQSTNSS